MERTGRQPRWWARAVALALALFCVISVLPLPASQGMAEEKAYGRVNADNVKVRKSASTSADYWFKLPKGWVSQVVEVQKKDGITWYKVITNGPTQGTRTYHGYIHGDYFTPMTAEEQAAWLSDPVQPGVGVVGATASPLPEGATAAPPAGAATPIPDPSNLGRINKGGVNFRQKPNGQVIRKLDNGTIVELLEIPAHLTENDWFKIKYGKETGYIQGPLITILTKAQAEAYLSQATAAPGTPVTAAPADTVLGYVRLLQDAVNLRETPGGSVITRIDGKPVLAYYKQPVLKNKVFWFYVKINNVGGYVHGDFAVVTDSEGKTLAPGAATATPAPTNTPAPTVTASPVPADTVLGYVRLLQDAVNLRETAGGSVITRIDGKPVLAYYKQPVIKNKVTWYYVKVNNVNGYVHGDFAVVTDSAGKTLPPAAATATPAPTEPPEGGGTSAYGYIKLSTDKVKLRKTPNGSTILLVSLGQVLPLTGTAQRSGAYDWYPVRYTDGRAGYIRDDMASPCDQNGTVLAATPAPAPTIPGSAVGYVLVNKDNVNLRNAIGGSTIKSLKKGTVWPMVSAGVISGGYTWYPVNVDGTKGFLRSDASYQMDAAQVEAYLAGKAIPTPGPTPTPTPGPSKFLVTILDDVNIRASASKDAKAPYNVKLGTVIPFTGSNMVGGVLWYKVTYQDSALWVLGSCVKVMTTAEYEAWQGTQPTPTPTPTPKPTPAPEDLSDLAETAMTNVLVRATGSSAGKQVTKIYEMGVIVTLTGTQVKEGTYTWYGVKLKSGTAGFIRGDLLRILSKEEKKAYEESSNPGSGGNSGGLQEATYETLRKGSTGEAVKALQAALKEKNFFSGTISGTYGTDTVDAVKAFQKSKGLVSDGIAGPNTLHALYGTVPVGSGDADLTNTIYPVEKIDWNTGGINTLWARGKSVKITDVKTGITFWARRWAGGSHVDAEPLTAADTKRICRIYGVSKASQITDSKHWHRRPLWVTIGTRTFAASMYGVPHNPKGDTIPNNDYEGQFCVHFTNSKTHDSDKIDPFHTEAIQYAYDAYHKAK